MNEYPLTPDLSQLTAVACVVSMVPIFAISVAAILIRTLRALGWIPLMRKEF